MSGPHVVSWLSVLAAAIGLGGTSMRLLALLIGLRWALSDAAQGDRAKIFCEFARAVPGHPTRLRSLVHAACQEDLVCVRRPPTGATSDISMAEPLAGEGKPRSDTAVQEHGGR